MTKFIVKTVEVVFFCLLVVILLAMSVTLAEEFLDGWFAFFAGIVSLVCVMMGSLFFKEKIKKIWFVAKQKLSKLSAPKMMMILFLFSAITKIFFVFLFDNNADLHPDMKMYRSFAKQIAESGKVTENAGYASDFKYTLIYGMLFSPLVKLLGDDTKVFTTALSIMNAISVVLLFDILRKYVSKSVAFVAMFLYCSLPFGLFQTQLFIHENGLLFFHVIATWLFLKVFEGNLCISFRLLCAFLSFLALGIGKSINASGRVVVMSFAIYAVAKIFRKGCSFKRVLCGVGASLLLVLCYVVSSAAVGLIVRNTIENVDQNENENHRLFYGWSLYVGFNYDSKGGRTDEDAKTYEKYQEMETPEEASEYQKKLVIERIKNYTPTKLITHLFNKVKVLFGTQLLPFSYELGNSVNDFFLRGAGGLIYACIVLFNNISFLIIYSALFLLLVNKQKKIGWDVTPDIHCKMVIIGVTLALLLFEVTPKYVSHLHILFFFILAMSAKEFFETEADLSIEGEKITDTPDIEPIVSEKGVAEE